MIIIGLTGNLGAGKTTVAEMFERLGAKVFDADTIAKGLIEPGGACFKSVVREFGKGILVGKEIDRKKLAAIVFGDREKLLRLNRLIHPKVIKIIKEEISKLKNKVPAVVIEAALLIESGLHLLVTEVILVKANRRLQIQRVLKEKKMSRQQTLQRMKMQMTIKEKMKYGKCSGDTYGTRDSRIFLKNTDGL